MADEWFRSPEWTEEAKADFEARLKRARFHGTQYLRIKGLSLHAAGHVEGARELWLRVLERDGEADWLQQQASLEHLADSYASTDPDVSESYYRRLMRQPRLPNGTTMAYQVSLAELLLRRGTEADVSEAGELLAAWKANTSVPFSSVHFRWELALIDLAEADQETLARLERLAR